MGEGVDPTHMCQSLVEKIAQSKQLRAVADPDILLLFEDWLDELEIELKHYADKGKPLDPEALADELGLSESGALFLLTKLKREEKI